MAAAAVVSWLLPASPAMAAGATEPGVSEVPQADPCRRAGEGRFRSADPKRCQGTWVIYASLPDGGTWWHDKDGTNPEAAETRRKVSVLRTRLLRCGVASFESLSDWFDRFASDLVVVHSRPFTSAAQARVELSRAQRCGVNGYVKFSEHAIVGRD